MPCFSFVQRFKFAVKVQMNYLIYPGIYQPDIQSTASKTSLEEIRALALNIYFISMPQISNFVIKKGTSLA